MQVRKWCQTIIRATVDGRGSTAIEYALIATLIGVAIVSSVSFLGTQVSALFQSVATTM